MTLQYHNKPIREHAPSKRYGGVMTPYQWTRDEAGGWRIGFGPSSFLVAKGPGVSVAVGEGLYRQLESEWRHRGKPRRKA